MNHKNSLLTIKVIDFIIYIISYSSILYLGGITTYSPIYFLYSFALLIFLTYLFFSKIKITEDIILLLFTLVSLLISCLINQTILNGATINFIFGFFAYFILRAKKHACIKFIITHKNNLLNIILFIVIIDRIINFLNPRNVSLEVYETLKARNTLFYIYKYSYLFSESNTVGLILLMLLFFELLIDKLLNIKVNKLFLAIIIILIFLSFSRAAIIATIIGLVFFYLFILFKKSVNKLLVILFSILLITFLLILGYYILKMYMLLDLSFLTKIYIFEIVKNFLFNEANINDILFGIGMLKSLEKFNIYTHLLIFNILIEGGLIFFLFYFLFFVYLFIKYKYIKIFFLPIFICSLSSFLYVGFPLFFILVAMLVNIEEFSKNMNSKR